MLALVNGEPKILTLRQALDCYIDHRKDVILRRTQFDLDKALARAHILEGLKIALDYIDEVIQIIRSSYDDAKERLMERFGLTDIQAQAILDMRLKTLSGLQREKIEEEYKQLMELIEHLRAILNSERLVFEIIKEELLEIKDKFGDERKTKIVAAEGEIDIEDLIKEEQTVVTLTHFGYIKRMPIDTYRSQKRGGKGITGIATREEDFVKQIFTASTHDVILFFTNKGKVYCIKAYEVPEAQRTAKGRAVINLLMLSEGEKVTTIIPRKENALGNLIMATRNGLIKKTQLEEFASIRKVGKIAIRLLEGDELIGVEVSTGKDDILIASHNGKCIRFNEKDVRNMGRDSQGVRSLKLKEDDFIVDMAIVKENSQIITISENGYGKRSNVEEYRLQSRGGKGVKAGIFNGKTGLLAALKQSFEDEDILLIADNGVIIRTPINQISALSRVSQGVKVMRLKSDNKIVGVALVKKEENEVNYEDNEQLGVNNLTNDVKNDILDNQNQLSNVEPSLPSNENDDE